jgi:hypothetical protein
LRPDAVDLERLGGGLLSTKRKACSAAPLSSGQYVKANNEKGPGNAGAF